MKWLTRSFKRFLKGVIGLFKAIFNDILPAIGMHKWEYWEVRAKMVYPCGQHNDMEYTMTYLNRKCKWFGTEQHKISKSFVDGWHIGNIEHRSEIECYVHHCDRCFEIMNGYEETQVTNARDGG